MYIYYVYVYVYVSRVYILTHGIRMGQQSMPLDLQMLDWNAELTIDDR